jgi:CDP-diglyceride synthetase
MNGHLIKRRIAVNTALAVGGMIVWIVIAMITGQNEPWDTDLFWSYGLSTMLALNAIAAFIDPVQRVLKGIWSVALQPVALAFMSGEVGSMFPLGLIVFLVLGLGYSLGGVLGSFVKRRFFFEK